MLLGAARRSLRLRTAAPSPELYLGLGGGGRLSKARASDGRAGGKWTGVVRRSLCAAVPSIEQRMSSKLLKEFGLGTEVKVEDTSGGCGSKFELEVTSPWFEGKNKVAQARAVHKVIHEEIATMHAVKVTTKVPAVK
jgi:stress-induced morphogen